MSDRGAFRFGGRSAPEDVASSERPAVAPLPGGSPAADDTTSEMPIEPGILAVQRAALAYQGLGSGPMDAAAEGLRRRAWFPVIELRASRGRDALFERDSDATVNSGNLYRLEDRTRDSHRDLQLALLARWDFGGLAYDPEILDVSKERRERVELRDEVLDEISQLYFERLRVLAEAESDPSKAAAGRLRAAELSAGLDAWTGGWWSATRGAPGKP